MNDLISRQDAIGALKGLEFCHYMEFGEYIGEDTRKVRLIRAEKAQDALQNLPSAQPEPLTDIEQRIFLAAMGREEDVCKKVDAECRDCREPYEDSLVRICHEIIRKVKGALWT